MTFYVENETDKTFSFDVEEIVRIVAEETLNRENCPYETQVNVLLTDNTGIQEFNSEYRMIDRETDEEYLEDLKSQIYINASRCTEKFNTYNKAVWLLCWAIPFALLYIAFSVLFLAQR